MPCPFLIVSQPHHLIQIVDTNSHTEWQTVQIQISWPLQKPADLDLHCFQKQDISEFSRTRVKVSIQSYYDLYFVDPEFDEEPSLKKAKVDEDSSEIYIDNLLQVWVVGWCEGVVYLTSRVRPTDIGLQLVKACYPCSRLG